MYKHIGLSNKKRSFFLKNKKTYLTHALNRGVNISSYAGLLRVFFKKGFLLRYSKIVGDLVSIFYFDLYLNSSSINVILLDHNIKKFYDLLYNALNIVKPPFIIQTTSVPKKLKRKIGLKYLVKIVYTTETSRVKTATKQIINNSSLFADPTVGERIYKSFVEVLLLGKDSTLFKKKLFLLLIILL